MKLRNASVNLTEAFLNLMIKFVYIILMKQRYHINGNREYLAAYER